MGKDAFMLNRRTWLAQAAGLALAGQGRTAWALPPSPGFAAAWEMPEAGWRIGLLALGNSGLGMHAALEVPTRAHGLLWQNRQLLAVARRPGDWLVRWTPGSGKAEWVWVEPDRALNGHVIASADGRQLYTSETSLETGGGLIGVRDSTTLEKIAEWPSGGADPHTLVLDSDGSLLVANGGIPTLPETGRVKIALDRMDSSLARLDMRSGAIVGQWRLVDQRLGMRHVAWGSHAGTRVLGIALQAEHSDPAQRREAPVLALFDGRALRTADASTPMAGYGGDVAFTAGRFAVSCPRANGVALYDGAGRWQGFHKLDEACALATEAGASRMWAGGGTQALRLAGHHAAPQNLAGPLRLDNHWLALGSLPGGST
jgi:hypothetical protein